MSPTSRPLTTAALAQLFHARTGLDATFFVRAPGRVNLIGEHIDYNDLAVLPAAIQREVRIVLRPRDDAHVRLTNVDERFGTREFELSSSIAPFEQGDWGNYAKAAAELFARERGATRGFDALVIGDIPPAAGLSSSSALTVACGLAFAAANGLARDPLDLADALARAERYVGTNSGGMDQAACLSGRADHALRIEFRPLKVEPVPLPSDWRFLIAHSGVQADKSGAAREAYNTRRAECAQALAAVLIDPELTPELQAGMPPTYRGLLARIGAERLAWIALRQLDGALARRFRHVVSEGARVERARKALVAGDIEIFGQLMDDSHTSLADDYEASHPALDRLVALAHQHGALGARLTGAGFGGCIVALVRERDAERLRAALERDFYGGNAGDALLIARASAGASVEPLAQVLARA
ncbi:MAG: galactokinase [Planctomycetota bacterium]|nr:galactokinase [Planctomycetota bacterium]